MTNIFLVVINRGGSGGEVCLSPERPARVVRPDRPTGSVRTTSDEDLAGFPSKAPSRRRLPQGPDLWLSPVCPSAILLAALPPCPGCFRQIFLPCKPGTDVRSLCSGCPGAPSVASAPWPVF